MHSTKFHMGCDSGWFIAAKRQHGIQNPSAFIIPFLDSAKMTKDTLAIVKELDNKRTTAEWEVFITTAQVEWEEFDAQRPLRAVMEQSSGEEGEDKSIGSTEGKLSMAATSSWMTLSGRRPPRLWSLSSSPGGKGEEAKGNTVIADKVEELQVAVEDLHVLYSNVSKALQDQSVEVLDCVWLSVAEVIKAIDRLNVWEQLWKEVIGDFNVLREERALMDMSSKLAKALGLFDALELDFASRLDKMSPRLDLWEDVNVCNLMHLSKKLKGLTAVQPAPLPAPPTVTPVGFSLTFSTPIMDDNGIQVEVLDGVFGKLNALQAKNIKFGEWLDTMRADLMAQGGVMFGNHTFTSEIQVLQVALAECLGGEAFALFVNPVSIFCHNAQYSPGSTGRRTPRQWRNWVSCHLRIARWLHFTTWSTPGGLRRERCQLQGRSSLPLLLLTSGPVLVAWRVECMRLRPW
jgi:hypothetical protein